MCYHQELPFRSLPRPVARGILLHPPPTKQAMSLLSIVERCDNFKLSSAPELVPFYLDSESTLPIGFIFPNVLELLEHTPLAPPNRLIIEHKRVQFCHSANNFEARSSVMKTICENWRDGGHFADVIGGRLWRNELYGIYPTPFTNITTSNAAFAMERVACALFGLVTYGVHLTLYTEDLRIWVPRRSKTKQTYVEAAGVLFTADRRFLHRWPGFLDNSVAGGIPYGMSPKESIIKECLEEASIGEDISRGVQCAGSVSYFFQYVQSASQSSEILISPPGHRLVIYNQRFSTYTT